MRNAPDIALADGGIETELMGRLGQDLPEFAAFTLLDSAPGREALARYFAPYLAVARAANRAIVLDTPTWRASADWGTLLGYDADRLAAANADGVALLRQLAEEHAPGIDATVNGCVGPRTDEYVAWERMTAFEAERYHEPQVRALAEAGADLVTGVTLMDAPEAIGIVRAATACRVPVAISFTVGADGLLVDGQTLAEAITAVDAATDAAASHFLVNCAHSSEVAAGIAGEPVLNRIGGLRLNAARAEQDEGDAPESFAAGVLDLAETLPGLVVLGGCCGTDEQHIRALASGLAARGGSGATSR